MWSSQYTTLRLEPVSAALHSGRSETGELSIEMPTGYVPSLLEVQQHA
jgi:hypothetical protein